MVAPVGNWLKQARRDLEAADVNFKARQFYVCVFLCQQASEKGLKSVILKKTKELIKTHDLKFLAKKAGAPIDLQMKASFLTPYFVESRYPDFEEGIPADAFNKIEAKETLKQTRAILDWVEKNV